MSQIVWIGNLTTQKQIDTFTPANVESTDTFTLTATGDDGSSVAISFNATGATVANVTAGLVAAWNASTHRLCQLALAADNTTNLTLTAVTAGVPFSVAATTTDHGGANTQTLTRAATQANIGPNDVSLAGNYQANVMFVASDTVTLNGLASSSLLYGLNQSAITLTKLDVKRPASIYVGNPDQAYYLRVSATTLNIGEQVPGAGSTGSQFIAIDTGSNAATVNLFSSTTAGLNGLPPVLLKGSHASNVLNILGGNGGLGMLTPGEASSFPNINMLNGTFTVGSGVTGPTLLSQDGGTFTLNVGATTVKQNAGTLNLAGSGNITTFWAGGKLISTGTGKIATLEVPAGGVADFSSVPATAAAPVTFAGTVILHAGATLNIDNGIPGSLVIDNPLQLYHASTEGVAKATVLMPKHMQLTVAKI
jgi:hypothetical protein